MLHRNAVGSLNCAWKEARNRAGKNEALTAADAPIEDLDSPLQEATASGTPGGRRPTAPAKPARRAALATCPAN